MMQPHARAMQCAMCVFHLSQMHVPLCVCVYMWVRYLQGRHQQQMLQLPGESNRGGIHRVWRRLGTWDHVFGDRAPFGPFHPESAPSCPCMKGASQAGKRAQPKAKVGRHRGFNLKFLPQAPARVSVCRRWFILVEP